MTRKFLTRHLAVTTARLAATSALAASLAVSLGWPATAAASPGSGKPPSWTVYHGDPAGSGNAASVRSVSLRARVWTSPTLDGQLYGQPLVFC